ncbi:MAG: beta-ketoacyl synthase chain length factor [Stenotrophomonas sp.]
MIGFSITEWTAWAPGLVQREQWLAWARQPVLPQGGDTPALAEVPAMQRRRIERLGRMAIQAACWCEDENDDARVPLVFASRHGDVARSAELLNSLAAGEGLSPTAFGLSVHNAVAALYSIARGKRGNYLSVAAGKSTVEAACVEAFGLLAEGAPEVRVVCYEAPLPAMYAGFRDEPDACFAWCWRLAAAGRPGVPVTLEWARDEAAGDTPPGLLPHALDVHRFLLAGDARLEFTENDRRWRWSRHG